MAIQPVTMDKISPVTKPSAVTNSVSNSDAKNLQTQITSKKQHMKQISSDNTITATEKEEKRRQLQKEIDELNRQLQEKKQEQEEKAKEAAKKQAQAAALREELLDKSTHANHKEGVLKTSSDDANAAKAQTSQLDANRADALEKDAQKADQKRTDMSVKEIQQMLSSDYVLQKELAQEQADAKLENTIDVLRSEINQDILYGTDTTHKEAEVETLQSKEKFWTDAQQKVNETQKQEKEQAHMQTAINANAKVVIDHI